MFGEAGLLDSTRSPRADVLDPLVVEPREHARVRIARRHDDLPPVRIGLRAARRTELRRDADVPTPRLIAI